MKKLLSLTAAFLSLFLLASCTQMETDNSSVPSLPGSSESSQSQSKEDPDSLPIYLNAQLKEQNRANQNSCSFIAEDERSYYYRHPIKGTLYRYDKETGRQKELFDQNRTFNNSGYLYGIQLYDNRIYFCSATAETKNGALFSIDRNGEDLKKIVEYIGGSYVITDDAIFYELEFESGLAKYDRKAQAVQVIEDGIYACNLNLVGNNLYYIGVQRDANGEYTGYEALCKYNIKTGVREELEIKNKTYEMLYHNNLYYLDGKLYLKSTFSFESSSKTGIFEYDLKSEKIKEIISDLDFESAGCKPGDVQINYFHPVGPNFMIVNSAIRNNSKNALCEIKNGEKFFTFIETGDKGDHLYVKDGKPILVPYELGYDIPGLEDLSRTVDDEQAA